MRRLIFAGFLLAGPAMAQPPQEVTAPETMQVRVNQTRTFRFDYSVGQINLSNKGVASVIPESDRIVNITGLAQGDTLMTAYGTNGRVVYQTNISVLQSGGLVKIYGLTSGKDFIGYQCEEFGCSRADKDAPPVPFSTTVSEQKPDGVTISREYR